MKVCNVTIKWLNGFHLRPASCFVKKFGKVNSDIKIKYNDTEVDGKSILGLGLLSAPCNALLNIKIDGDDEEQVFSDIIEFFEDDQM